ncbi:Uncharacterized protein Fot_37940 [Forsythia ovata]|uniref:Uncharacterized protein n=1 Tax=Forsythia ovata TaxID=205694 RepID=A0ABD1S2P8_9LAMI
MGVAELGNPEIGGGIDVAKEPEGAGIALRESSEGRRAGANCWDAIDPPIMSPRGGASMGGVTGDWVTEGGGRGITRVMYLVGNWPNESLLRLKAMTHSGDWWRRTRGDWWWRTRGDCG